MKQKPPNYWLYMFLFFLSFRTVLYGTFKKMKTLLNFKFRPPHCIKNVRKKSQRAHVTIPIWSRCFQALIIHSWVATRPNTTSTRHLVQRQTYTEVYFRQKIDLCVCPPMDEMLSWGHILLCWNVWDQEFHLKILQLDRYCANCPLWFFVTVFDEAEASKLLIIYVF